MPATTIDGNRMRCMFHSVYKTLNDFMAAPIYRRDEKHRSAFG